MHRIAALVLSVLFVVAGCTSGTHTGLGGSCRADADCGSGMCATADGRQFCSVECTSAADCTGGVSGALVCDASAGHCVPRCSDGSTRGSGAGRELCQGGSYVACSGLDDVTACMSCGCEPFGGGNCLSGMGCVMPSPDGTACTLDGQCSSRRCFADTHVCGAPRAMGDPCTADDDCATENCSNDGDVTTPGHCNQMLGTSCMGASGPTATCTRCNRIDSFSNGICMRTACAPITHDHCPQLTDRVWECVSSVDGLHHCYETCPRDGIYSCYDPFTFCNNGYCG